MIMQGGKKKPVSSLKPAHFYTSGSVKITLGLSIGLLTAALTVWPVHLGVLQDVELLTVDQRFQYRGAQRDLRREADVIILEITDDDQQDLPEKFPFPRSYYAHVIENLNRAGARVIAIDLTFETAAPGDSALRAVLSRYDNVVLAVKDQPMGERRRYTIERLEQDYNNVFFEMNPHVGVVNILTDRDDVIRRYAPMWNVGGHLTPTFAFSVVARTLGFPPGTTTDLHDENYFILGNLHVPRFNPRSFLLDYYGPVRSFRYVPFSQVIDDERFQTRYEAEAGEEENLFDEGMMSVFKDKIVLIGSTMAEDRDIYNGPLYDPADSDRSHAIYGIEIHATAIQNLLDRQFIRRPPLVLEAAVLPLLSLLTFMLVFWFKQLNVQPGALLEGGALGLTFLLLLCLYGGSLLAFSQAGLLVSLVAPGLSILASMVGASAYVFLHERQQKALIKDAFGRYVSPAVVNDLINSPTKISLGGELRELTVLFTDIAGFTTLAEGLDPEALVTLLNEYFNAMTNVVFNYKGTIDKFIGDAIMAIWGAPVRLKDHALQACLTALEMQNQLEELRRKWQAEGKPEITIRCGINTGPMVVGNMGGEARFDYTVIGDSVNLASRLEGTNKLYGTQIIISEFTYACVREQVRVRELDLVQVKGKTKPITIYELLGLPDMPITAEQQQTLDLYARGLQHYKQREWTEAFECMHQVYVLDPACQPAYLYIQRTQEFIKDPPPESWDGTFQITTK